MQNHSRVFTREGREAQILKEVIAFIPPKTKVYVVGGAARNTVYHELFKKSLPQRDYDVLVIGGFEKFIENIRSRGFIYGSIRRKNEITLKKKMIPKPKSIADYLVLDVGRAAEPDILENLKNKSAFTINGFAIPLRHYLSKNIKKHIVSLPEAKKDLRNKRLRLNVRGYKGHPGNLFSCLRFMSLGFKPPKKDEVKLLLDQLPKLEKRRFGRNVRKVFRYVGGEKKARLLAKRLGIKADIFDLNTLRKNSR